MLEHVKPCLCLCILTLGGMQEIVTEFMVETMSKAMAASALKGGKPSTEDMMFLVRKVLLTHLRVMQATGQLCSGQGLQGH